MRTTVVNRVYICAQRNDPLSNFAVAASDPSADEEVARAISEFHLEKKPMAFCCIAPILVALVLGKGGTKVPSNNTLFFCLFWMLICRISVASVRDFKKIALPVLESLTQLDPTCPMQPRLCSQADVSDCNGFSCVRR